MIDYILNFPDQASAQNALSDWHAVTPTGLSHWKAKPKCGIMEITVVNQRPQWDVSDPENPILITPQQCAVGYWMAIAMPQINDQFWSLPFVLSEHDRALAQSGQSHLLRTKLTPEQIEGVSSIHPIFAGANYPF